MVASIDGEEEERVEFEMAGFGFVFVADAVVADIRAGRAENETCSLATKLLMILERMDEARRLCGLTYEQDE